MQRYPSGIFTLAYQDGVIHAFERFIQNHKTGEYNRPCHIEELVAQYERMSYERHALGDYWNEAYYLGYTNGLILIRVCDDNPEKALSAFPFFYLPSKKNVSYNMETYRQDLERVSTAHSKYHRYAKKIIEEKASVGIVVHRPPY